MNNHEAEVLACAALLSDGMRSELFIQCLPSEGSKETVPRLLLKGYLDDRDGIIRCGLKNNKEIQAAIDPDDAIVFLVHLLEYIKKQNIEQNPDYLLCCNVFYTACKKYAGDEEDRDAMLSFLYAELIDLLGDKPLFHVIGENTVLENGRDVASVLMEAEVLLAYKWLEKAFLSDGDSQIRLFKFAHNSWESIISIEQQLNPKSSRLEDFRTLLTATQIALQKSKMIQLMQKELKRLEDIREEVM